MHDTEEIVLRRAKQMDISKHKGADSEYYETQKLLQCKESVAHQL